ncbi:MAG: hypothetical protein FJ087_22185, partial [Deltaproteobacteria bacterium]|nr:hypothetical protein [Deltaproteobacteria bacterium]
MPPSYLAALFGAGRFDILLPARTEYTTVTGVVARGAQNEEPVRGARVTATVAQPLSQKTVRNSAITDDEGRFSIVVTGQGAITVRVEPGKDSPLFVQVTTPGGATRTSSTGKDGVAKLSIPDGTYTLAVMPPAGSELAAKWVPLSVSADMQTLLPLDPRVRLAGRVVRNADDVPVANAVVTLVTNRVASLGSVSEALQDVSFDAVTEADGSFVVFVDPGRYALSVEPPPESGLGRFAHPDLAITDAAAVAALQVKVPLPAGVLVHGQVFRQATGTESNTPKAVPVPGARVRFFFEVPAAMSEAVWSLRHDASFAAMLQLAGAAESDGAGRFGAVVPAIEALPIGNGKGVGYWDGETGMGPAPGGEPSAGAGGDAMG